MSVSFRVVSPYRVCPLGAHIDHQGAAVLGAAISAQSVLVAQCSDNGVVRLQSADFDGVCEFLIDNDAFVLESPLSVDSWTRYVVAAARVLRCHVGQPLRRGIVGHVRGTLPACGVSSSASVGLAYIAAFAHANAVALTPVELIMLDRALENDCLGLRNGILDQSSIVLGKRECLVRIDTRTAQHELMPVAIDADPFRILLVHSGLSRALASPTSGYNNRVAECRAAAEWLGERAGIRPVGTDSLLLSDIPATVFEQFQSELLAHDPKACLRARHFFSEVDRVRRGGVAWQAGNLVELGRLMNESCQSSISQYECGAPQLEQLHEIITETKGVFGSRFSGAGFGGAVIGIVDEREFDDEAAQSIRDRYCARFPELRDKFQLHLLDIADGLQVVVEHQQ